MTSHVLGSQSNGWIELDAQAPYQKPTLERYGEDAVSLGGTTTRNTYARKLRWEIPLGPRGPIGRLQILERKPGPFYLLDVFRPNLLPPRGGRLMRGWTTTAGAAVAVLSDWRLPLPGGTDVWCPDLAPVTPGQVYTAGMDFTGSGQSIGLRMRWLRADLSVIDTYNVSTVLSNGLRRRFSEYVTAPAGAVWLRLGVYGAGWASGAGVLQGYEDIGTAWATVHIDSVTGVWHNAFLGQPTVTLREV